MPPSGATSAPALSGLAPSPARRGECSRPCRDDGSPAPQCRDDFRLRQGLSDHVHQRCFLVTFCYHVASWQKKSVGGDLCGRLWGYLSSYRRARQGLLHVFGVPGESNASRLDREKGASAMPHPQTVCGNASWKPPRCWGFRSCQTCASKSSETKAPRRFRCRWR